MLAFEHLSNYYYSDFPFVFVRLAGPELFQVRSASVGQC